MSRLGDAIITWRGLPTPAHAAFLGYVREEAVLQDKLQWLPRWSATNRAAANLLSLVLQGHIPHTAFRRWQRLPTIARGDFVAYFTAEAAELPRDDAWTCNYAAGCSAAVGVLEALRST